MRSYDFATLNATWMEAIRSGLSTDTIPNFVCVAKRAIPSLSFFRMAHNIGIAMLVFEVFLQIRKFQNCVGENWITKQVERLLQIINFSDASGTKTSVVIIQFSYLRHD